jgi:hypothetical protein
MDEEILEEIINTDTSGFYKNDNGDLLYGTKIYGPYGNFYLTKEEKDNYTYPVDGWYWFDSIEDARGNLK